MAAVHLMWMATTSLLVANENSNWKAENILSAPLWPRWFDGTLTVSTKPRNHVQTPAWGKSIDVAVLLPWLRVARASYCVEDYGFSVSMGILCFVIGVYLDKT